jgi:hypothetical protein
MTYQGFEMAHRMDPRIGPETYAEGKSHFRGGCAVPYSTINVIWLFSTMGSRYVGFYSATIVNFLRRSITLLCKAAVSPFTANW